MNVATVLGLAGGFGLGLAYFALLALEARAFAERAPLGRHLLLLAGRLVPALILFWLLVQYGAAVLLAGFAGFLVARFVVLRRKTA